MRASSILDEFGKPLGAHKGERPDAITMRVTHNRQAALTFDAARSETDLDGHWKFADFLSPDAAHNTGVRRTLVKRSRYEQGSNAFYAGIIDTHCNMLVGTGPQLRMLTRNRLFNQLVEREFANWATQTQLRRKLWAMSHATTGDGESFGLLITNPALPDVQLDILPIEAEQCQSASFDGLSPGRLDGIYYDESNNIIAYDILPEHPGGQSTMFLYKEPIRVPAHQVVHWFKLKRPSAHRGIPALTAGLNTGAFARRHREATVAAAETAADIAAMLTTTANSASDAEPDPVAPFTSVEFAKRMLMMAPMGWDAKQMKGEHPNAQYAEFHRLNLSELARGLSMPYNAAACDSSTYSFASGKLDTLCYRAALDVERQDANDMVLDRIFEAWFAEWTVIHPDQAFTPAHQWDWPCHPVIDAVAEAVAANTKLQNGSTTHRQVYSDAGQDYEDQLSVMAEDWFGEATDETIAKARQINLLRTIPQPAVAYVAQILGLQPVNPGAQPPTQPHAEAFNDDTVVV